MQVSQPESRPSGTGRYLRLVHPVVRGCRGVVAAVAVFAAAGAIGGRGGLALASGCLVFLGFARTGYHATTMADVANEAGVSKGTPYLYFSSKETLYVALHDQWDCALGARIDAAIGEMPAAHQRSPRRVLRALVAAVGAHVTDDPQTCRVLMEARTLAAYQPAVAAAVQDADARARRQLAGLIQADITAGQWPAGTDPELRARLITATLHGMMAQWHLARGSFSWDAVADTLTRD